MTPELGSYQHEAGDTLPPSRSIVLLPSPPGQYRAAPEEEPYRGFPILPGKAPLGLFVLIPLAIQLGLLTAAPRTVPMGTRSFGPSPAC